MKKINSKTQTQKMCQAFTTSDFYQLLSLSLEFPSKKLVNALLDGSYRKDGINILTELSCSQETILQVSRAFEELESDMDNVEKLLRQMRQEFTRLFNHPVNPIINIYESTFLNAHGENDAETLLFLSSNAINAESCYKDAELQLANCSGEPADHMRTELEFMMYLYENKGRNLQRIDDEALEKIHEQIKQFEDMHLGKWCYEFFHSLEINSRHAFYNNLAVIAKLGLEKVLINSKVEHSL